MKAKILLAATILLFLNISIVKAQIWEQTNGPFGCFITSLAVHPNGDLYASESERGLYRSTNNGDSWDKIGFTEQFIQIQQIFISKSGYIFLKVWDQQYNIFRSTDNGATWHQLNISFMGTSCFEDDGIGNIYISFEENNDNTILRSTDGGDNWAVWSIFMGNVPNDLLFYDDNNYIFLLDGANRVFRLINNNWVQYSITNNICRANCIEVTNSGVLLAGVEYFPSSQITQGIFRSLDNGITWQRVYSNNIENTDVRSITVNSAGIIFAGTSQGVFKSTDNGATWSQIGIEYSSVLTLVSIDSSFVIALSYGSGVYRWNEPSNFWEDINLGLFVDITFSLAYNQSNQHYYAATSNGLFLSSDRGETWENKLDIYIGGDIPDEIRKVPLLFEPNSNAIYVARFGELFRSTDNGISWDSWILPSQFFYTLVSTSEPGVIWAGGRYLGYVFGGEVYYSDDYGITWSENFYTPNPVKCLQFSNIANIFAGSVGSGVYRSTNGGLNWRDFNIGLLNYYVESITTNSSGDIFAGTHNGVFRSKDLSGNWQYVGLSQDTVITLVCNSLDYILAGTMSGLVYISTDNGESWNDYSYGLNASQVRCLILDENDFATVGTATSGVFRTVHSTVNVENKNMEIPTKFLLSQNYPNPFNPSTSIQYAVSSRQFVTLKVYDVLGNEIETLVNEEKPASIYEITWYAEELQSGVYFYQLRAGSFVQTKKMLLLK